MMKHVKLFELFNRSLPESFVDQLRKIYEMDSEAIVCGSTALFLHGCIGRIPNDLDVIVKDSSKLSKIAESAKDFDEAELNDAAKRNGERIEKLAKRTEDFYVFIEGVKYLLGGEEALGSNLPDEAYETVLAIWKKSKGDKKEYYKKKNESFEFKFSAKDDVRVCVFESKGVVPHTAVDVNGIRVLLENVETILEYKEFYGRDKDVKDLNEIKFTMSSAGMIPVGAKPQALDPSKLKIKKADWDGMFEKVQNLPSAKRIDLIKKLHSLGLL